MSSIHQNGYIQYKNTFSQVKLYGLYTKPNMCHATMLIELKNISDVVRKGICSIAIE